MLVPFLIMLREGVEAALIVGIIAGYLKSTGRAQWMPLVWVGIVAAVLICLALGIVLDMVSADFPQKEQELFAAVIGLIAVCLLTSMVFWMRKASRSIKGELQHSIDEALGEHSGKALALVFMAFLAVAREGLESVFFLLATFQQGTGLDAPIGALAGVLVAGAIGYAIYVGTVRLNLRRFFRWTGVLILVVAAGLLAGSLRALHEAGIWNGLQQVVFDLSHVLPTDGIVGSILSGVFGYVDTPTLGEVIVYVVFLAITLPLFLLAPRAAGEAASRA